MRRSFKKFLQELIKEKVYYCKIKQEEWFPNNWVEKFSSRNLIIIYRRNILPGLKLEQVTNYLKEKYKNER